MPEVTITIGGRDFQVACQDGEESYLQSAAQMLDDEAQTLASQIGRMPEARMLLMAGLMLADKTAAFEDKIKTLEQDLTTRDAEAAALRVELAAVQDAPPKLPEGLVDTLAGLAQQAEAVAGEVDATQLAEE